MTFNQHLNLSFRMKHLQKGEFFGQTNKTIYSNGLILTDTEYTKPTVDWHYHQNAYFTFILQGQVLEGNKKEIYHCGPGSLLFHNWQEPHYNIKPEGFTRGFHIEMESNWFRDVDLKTEHLQGSINIKHPWVKLLMYQIFGETNKEDSVTELSVHSLLIAALSQTNYSCESASKTKPDWVKQLDEILNDQFADNLTLSYLAEKANIHPVHLSRDFSKYFGCNLGQYIRKIRIVKALALFSTQKMTLTDIAYRCGFFDQSHLTRCFKEINGINPSAFRKLLVG